MLMVSFAESCTPEKEIEFLVDTDLLQVKPQGGEYAFKLSVDEEWVVKTNAPWITVSPANGHGSVECRIQVDSSLLSEAREGKVDVKTMYETRTINVVQEGFELKIEPKKPLVEIEDFAVLNKRRFEVVVNANTEFNVEIPNGDEGKPWLYLVNKDYHLDLDRGARPRNVTLKFEWSVNPKKNIRNMQVNLVPKDNDSNIQAAAINVRQGGAPDIESYINTREGDSLALLSISRFLGCWSEVDTGQKLERWTGVTVHESGDYKGRVKSAQFVFFETDEPLPYAVKYLTAADELYFFSNVNSFQKNLDLGKDICELQNLKKLTLFSYGLSTLPPEMENMTSLRFLDLGGNNFSAIPKVLQKCKNLKALILTANQRTSLTDLSNGNKKDIAGLIDECPSDGTEILSANDCDRKFPVWLLAWDQLDTLRLSVNFLQGTLPTDEELLNHPDYTFKPWNVTTFDENVTEVNLADSLGRDNEAGLKFFTDNQIPMVLPNTDFFSFNLNRLHGNVPNWLKYHPKLDYWTPLQLVFPQEGKDVNGHPAGFNDVPTNLNYYYEIYKKKKWSETNIVK